MDREIINIVERHRSSSSTRSSQRSGAAYPPAVAWKKVEQAKAEGGFQDSEFHDSTLLPSKRSFYDIYNISTIFMISVRRSEGLKKRKFLF